MFNFDDIRQSVSLEEWASSNLERAKAGHPYVCPFCNSGGGESASSNSAFSIRGAKFKCFSCQTTGDVFDLAGRVWGIDGAADRLEAVARWAGYQLPEHARGEGRPVKEKPKGLPSYRPELRSTREATEPEAAKWARDALNADVERWRSAMVPGCGGWRYMTEVRGFTPEEIARFGLGWDGRNVTVPYPDGKGGAAYWFKRGASGDFKSKPPASAAGSEPLFNAPALAEGGPVFVVEGQFDALSVEACGFRAVALGTAGVSGNGPDRLTEALGAAGFSGTLHVMLDADETGRAEGVRVADKLNGLGYAAGVVDFSQAGGAKDPNELLATDRAELAAFLASQVPDPEVEANERYWRAMEACGAADSMAELWHVVQLDDAVPPVPTGIAALDRLLDGGLRPGVAVIGGISSTGKTTAALQMADHMASRGRPVLFASIEQTAREMVIKSIGRLMRAHGVVKAERSIGSAQERSGWTDADNAAFDRACADYQGRIAPWLVFLEGCSAKVPVGARQVEDAARRMAERCGMPPVVFVDYLQLMAPLHEGVTERKATDESVTALRQMANKLGTPVVCVASLNRASYYSPVDLESFKESGGIEYGADVVMGMQPRGLTETYGEAMRGGNEAQARRAASDAIHSMKASVSRKVEFRVLKQRGGAAEGAAPVTYLPVCNSFFSGDVVPEPGATAPGISIG